MVLYLMIPSQWKPQCKGPLYPTLKLTFIKMNEDSNDQTYTADHRSSNTKSLVHYLKCLNLLGEGL